MIGYAAIELLGLFSSDEEEEEKPKSKPVQFSLDDIEENLCWRWFRFEKKHIHELVELLDIPSVKYSHGLRPNPLTALCMTLFKLAHPVKYMLRKRIFGYSGTSFTRIITAVLKHLCTKFKHVLYWDDSRINSKAVITHADYISYKCKDATEIVWAVVSEKEIPVCGPSIRYKGKYIRPNISHVVRYQCITTPDGIVISVFRADPGSSSDSSLWSMSKIDQKLMAMYPKGKSQPCPYVIYQDKPRVEAPEWGLTTQCKIPQIGSEQWKARPAKYWQRKAKYNEFFEALPEAGNWSFNSILEWFSPGPELKQHRRNSEYLFPASIFFANIYCCYYVNEISEYFDCEPPHVHEYLGVSPVSSSAN